MSRGMKGLTVLLAAFGVGRKFSHYTRHYRQHLLAADRRAAFTGSSIAGDNAPELDAVFVDVAVEPEEAVPAEGGARQSIHDFLDREEAAALAVIGGPGCGKTTLLRHLAHDAARRDTRRRRIPVFLTLSRLSTPISEEPSLPRLLRTKPPRLRVPEPRGWWEEQLHDGNCLILMDGLDEVADETDRRRIADWIAEQIKAFPGNDFVITSRPGGYRKSSIQGARVLALQPFSRTQSERFLRGWYQATGADDSGTDATVAEKTDDLIERLSGTPHLTELTTNPLLLTMTALVHRYRGALPRNRADLYEEVCRAMLWSRHEAHGAAVSGEAKWHVLARLAFNLMKSRQHETDSANVPPLIQDAPETDLPGIDSEQFLREVCADGLLVEIDRGRYAFAHHTIGEYLAAKHITDHEAELPGVVDDPWWAETIELYAARTSNLDKLVETCLRKGTEGAMAQALTYAGDGGRLDRRLRDRLRRLEQQAFSTGSDPAVSRAVARAKVSRHLGTLKRLGDNTFYCPHPITESLYRLHRNATNPEGPTTPAPADGHSISGLWPGEVKPFIDWINAVNRQSARTDPSFRLPYRDESELIRTITGPDNRTDPPPVWRTSARGPELPFTVTRPRLLMTVTKDIATAGLRAAAVFALLLDTVTTMKPTSAPTGPDSGGKAIRDRVDAVAATADTDGFRRLIARLSEIPAPRMSRDLVLSDATVVHRTDEAKAAAIRESLLQGIGKVYRDRRPESFGWLPPTAAAFTDRRHTEAQATATELTRQDSDDTDTLLAEVLLSRAGLTDPTGLRIVLGNTSPASGNPDIALRESVAPPGRWHESVSRDLAEKVRRILTRQDPLRAPAVLRLSGLIAAAEFEAERNQLNRDACLNIVALVTFLEHRTGTDYPGEALILVRD